ncbi:hypothetical protein KAFR_0C02120 [Kazachstania africana CBS 2517]|uniref:Uncharacterized protein n=1 Tax=Kazachstania africana (strain ATCC 22294 / BCRC 22015 / CBS 2517 / CECT 1963 / NBRC 1671 / NRRL Y-8276) TaxID=1071382 RepID=H2AS55_KAZAF|nr:hypothetical protein KAFR_0C02120 [Kazachstania africana CBS 2517]CCF57205.1 hypothetical protein KAFR_0C02120 [Kazachstania africana CBS 2517]
MLEFVSCLRISGSRGTEENDEVCICNAMLVSDTLPGSVKSLDDLTIDQIMMSEGTEIFEAEKLNQSDLQIFTSSSGTGDEDTYKRCIWYELLRTLTCHKLYIKDLESRVKYTAWTIRKVSDESWKVVMELESGAIVKKIAQFSLTSVKTGEMDLFKLSLNLFENNCKSNDRYYSLGEKYNNLYDRLKLMEEERTILDNVLEERDKSARLITVGLLNEKKKKILQLQEILKRHNIIDDAMENIPDLEAVNKNVVQAVSHLNSPGRRKRASTTQSKQSIPSKKRRRNQINEEQLIKQEAGSINDFDDFKFYGIGNSQLRDSISSPNKVRLDGQDKPVEVKQESSETKVELTPVSNTSTKHTEKTSSVSETDTDIESQESTQEETE